MGCPPVRGDNPRALASGLSYVQVGKHGILFYTTNISVDPAHHEIFHAKDGKYVMHGYGGSVLRMYSITNAKHSIVYWLYYVLYWLWNYSRESV